VDIDRRTDYAIRLLIELARRKGHGPISVRELSNGQDVPYHFARSIQRDLVASGLVIASRGAHGGVELALDPSRLTLLEVVEAMQGPVSCSVCTSDPEWCSQMAGCSVHGVWRGMDALLKDYLGRQDIAGLAAREVRVR
jgi:Rrf2 family protein